MTIRLKARDASSMDRERMVGISLIVDGGLVIPAAGKAARDVPGAANTARSNADGNRGARRGKRYEFRIIKRCPSQRIRRVRSYTIEGKHREKVGSLDGRTGVQDIEFRGKYRCSRYDVVRCKIVENGR